MSILSDDSLLSGANYGGLRRTLGGPSQLTRVDFFNRKPSVARATPLDSTPVESAALARAFKCLLSRCVIMACDKSGAVAIWGATQLILWQCPEESRLRFWIECRKGINRPGFYLTPDVATQHKTRRWQGLLRGTTSF